MKFDCNGNQLHLIPENNLEKEFLFKWQEEAAGKSLTTWPYQSFHENLTTDEKSSKMWLVIDIVDSPLKS